MNAIAELVAQKKDIYARASALTAGGQLSAYMLNGIIDVNRVQILSTMSNWRTDNNGNMIFEALDGGSAMMLSGSGFAIANMKREDGSWNWRTFGTGKGFTADEINAGTLNAGQITILGTNQFFWDADSIRVYTNPSGSNQIRIGRYDGMNYGIGFTNDNGITWKTALTADGLTISDGSITVDKLASNVGSSLDISSNTSISTVASSVSELSGKVEAAEQKITPTAIVNTVRSSDGYQNDMSTMQQAADKIYWLIDNGSTETSLTMKPNALSAISQNIDLTGNVTFNSFVAGLGDGTTTINGGCITTGTLSADRISGGTINGNIVNVTNINANNITSGTISASRIDTTNLYVKKISEGQYDSTYMSFSNGY